MLDLSWKFSLIAVGGFLLSQLCLTVPLSLIFRSIRSWRLGVLAFGFAGILTYILWAALVWANPPSFILGVLTVLVTIVGGFIADTARLARARGRGTTSFGRAYIGGFSFSIVGFWLCATVATAFIGAIALANGLTLKQITLSRHITDISMDVIFDGITYPATTTYVKEHTLYLGRQNSNAGWPRPSIVPTVRFTRPELLSGLPFDMFFNHYSSWDTPLLVATRSDDGIKQGFFAHSFADISVIVCSDGKPYCTRVLPRADQIPQLSTEEIVARAGSDARDNGQDFSMNVPSPWSIGKGLLGSFDTVGFYKILSFSFDTEHAGKADILERLAGKHLVLSNPKVVEERTGPLAEPGPEGNLWLSYIFYERFAKHIQKGCNRTGYLAWWNGCIYQEDVFADHEEPLDLEEPKILRPIPE